MVLLYDLPVSDMISADKTTLIADCFAIWRIEDPRLFIETLSGSVSNAEGRINANIYNALKTVLSSMTQAEIISAISSAEQTGVRVFSGFAVRRPVRIVYSSSSVG